MPCNSDYMDANELEKEKSIETVIVMYIASYGVVGYLDSKEG